MQSSSISSQRFKVFKPALLCCDADDSPLYIFDGTFADRRGSRAMRRDYEVPAHFREDLMRLAGDRRRPPYRRALRGSRVCAAAHGAGGC